MNRLLPALLLLLLLPPTPSQSVSSLHFPAKAGAGNGKRVVLLAGDEEYRSEEALPMLGKILSQRHGFDVTVLFSVGADGAIDPKATSSLSDGAALERAEAIVMSLRFRNWADADMARFAARLNAGVPIVALRTSTHAFNGFPAGSAWASWNYDSQGGFGKRVLGETWINHWGKHKVEGTRGVIEPAQRSNPLLKGIDDIAGDTDVYEAYPVADATVLVRGLVVTTLDATSEPASYPKKRSTDKIEQGINEPPMPVVWTRTNRNENGSTNRILTTTMGSATDLQNEGLRRLVVNGVYWGLQLPVPDKGDVRYVDPYQPSFYGFDGFRKGLHIGDFGLGKTVPVEPLQRPAPPAGRGGQ